MRRDLSQAICVYCGSKKGADPAFEQAARAFGGALARNGVRLVYGAGDLGLMGAVSAGCAEAGGETFGLIPRGLWEREVRARRLPGVVVTENMHQRKAMMLQNADACAVLPGGIGTLDELVEALTWRHIGLHGKPIMLLDVNGYWGPFIALLEHMASNGFVERSAIELLMIETDPAAAVEKLVALSPKQGAAL